MRTTPIFDLNASLNPVDHTQLDYTGKYQTAREYFPSHEQNRKHPRTNEEKPLPLLQYKHAKPFRC